MKRNHRRIIEIRMRLEKLFNPIVSSTMGRTEQHIGSKDDVFSHRSSFWFNRFNFKAPLIFENRSFHLLVGTYMWYIFLHRVNRQWGSKNMRYHKLRSETNQTKVSPNILFMKSPQNKFTFLPDYVSHEIFKEFRKNSHFENIRADFLRRCQNSPRQTSPEMMHFQARQKIF